MQSPARDTQYGTVQNKVACYRTDVLSQCGSAPMKTVAIVLLILIIVGQAIERHHALRAVNDVLASDHQAFEAKLQELHACQERHQYRFQMRGASTWRFDEVTGEACMITTSQMEQDLWPRMRCRDTN